MAFVAREHELQEANSYISKLVDSTEPSFKKLFKPSTPSNDSKGMAALSFFGIAGCGKSTLKRRILSLPNVNKSIITISYDFEHSSDTVDVLVELSRKLESKGCLCRNFNKTLSKLSRTSLRYAQYAAPSRRKSFLKDAIGGALPFPFGMIASFALQLVMDIVDLARSKQADGSCENDETEDSSIYLLVTNLKQDIKLATSLHSKPFLFIFDTYEKLTGVEKGPYAEEKDFWLCELLAMPSVGWITFGRGPIRNDIAYEKIELTIFSYKDVATLLQKNGIEDPGLIMPVCDASHGLPLFVSIFIDSWKRATENNIVITPEEVSSNTRLIETFLRHFDHQDSGRAEMLCLCSCVQKWNGEILSGIDSAAQGDRVGKVGVSEAS